MLKEIGSEFWKSAAEGEGDSVTALLPKGFDYRVVLSGRTALEIVVSDALKSKKLKKAYLPSYICHTMIEPFQRHGLEIRFYDVVPAENGMELLIDMDNDCDIVLLLDYFGFLNERLPCLARKFADHEKTVVYDATHSLFSKRTDDSAYDYVFGSFRKWFGVNAGFCAKKGIWEDFPSLSENELYTSKRNAAFALKKSFMETGTPQKNTFLKLFADAEEMLETDYRNYAPDSESLDTISGINIARVRKKRCENAAFLANRLSQLDFKWLKLPFKKPKPNECPLFLPILVDPKLRDDLRSHLIRNGVYLPVHWPLSQLHRIGDRAVAVYRSELSCVCDQRYGLDEMDRIFSLIRSYGNG